MNKRVLGWVLGVAMTGWVSASTLQVSTLEADEVRTREIGLLPPPASSDAVLYYDFESAPSGNVIVDKGANGYNGTAANCVWSSTGKFVGGAMAFANNVGGINVGSTPNFPSWDNYSVSVWFKHNGGGYTGPQSGNKIIDRTSMMHDWHLNVYPRQDSPTELPGRIGVVLYEGASTTMHDKSKDYRDNQWHHVAVIKNGVMGQLWVDGSLRYSSSTMRKVFSSSALCIGNSYSTDSIQRNAWSGLLDEVMIFDRALSSNEVANLFAEGVLSHPTNEAPAAITFTTNVVVQGALTVTGKVSFVGGVIYCKPLGDLSSGPYTNTTVTLP